MKLIVKDKSEIKVRVGFEETTECSKMCSLKEKKLFKGNYKELYPMLDLEGKGILFLGLGKENEINTLKIIDAFFFLSKEVRKYNFNELYIKFPKSFLKNETYVLKALEGILQEEYTWNDYKTDAKEKEELTISTNADFNSISKKINELSNVIEGANITRDLVNQPPVKLYPESYGEMIKDIFKNTEVEVEVFDFEQLQKMGLEALIQVGRGSDNKPRLIVMKYLPVKNNPEHLTLVGKGITYDSGGYALKPAKGMFTMKCDMAGSGAVVGALHALAKNKIQKNVVGVIGAAENLIGPHSYKNGDLIGSMKGTTIEVNNTDAEGRVTLADSLYYAATQLNTKAIVDLATLTGACIVSLGSKVSGMMSNNDEMADLMKATSKETDEHMHRFEIFDEHREMVKGKFGDLLNSVDGGAGSITAGVFLEHFVENKPWVHIDIAGPAFASSPYSYLPAGGTGHPVKTIYEFAKKF